MSTKSKISRLTIQAETLDKAVQLWSECSQTVPGNVVRFQWVSDPLKFRMGLDTWILIEDALFRLEQWCDE